MLGQFMTVFESIKDAIFGQANHGTDLASPSAPAEQLVGVLSSRAANNSRKFFWQTSIIDLMKLLGVNSSLAQRKRLAEELGYDGDRGDSAAMNTWLHSAVMRELAQISSQAPAPVQP
jgi:hypothetical protein